MEMHRFTMEPFDSRETSEPSYRQMQRREAMKRRTEPSGMGSVYRQTALCALIVALLIVLELFVFREEPEAVPASVRTAAPIAETAATETEEEGEESLGKLQFVNGRIFSVFSSDARWSLPFPPLEIETLEDGKLLCLSADAGTTVSAASAGQVVSVGQDAKYGTAVRVYHGENRESVYYGLGGVSVEVGQPLLAGDSIGVVGENGVLCLAALENGERVAVLDCFDADLTVT